MEFGYSEDQQMIVENVSKFVAERIKPHVLEWDEKEFFPVDLFHEMGELGLLGVLVPEEYGGSGYGYVDYVAILEEIGSVCGSIGLGVAAHNSLCTGHILQHGNEAQKQKYLPKLASGEHIGAWGLTEPGSGSDAGGMLSTAKKVEGGWMLNGTKNFITHAISGDVAVVLVNTAPELKTRGISAFILDKSIKGWGGGKKENKVGMRSSETAQLVMEDCFVPDENLIGEVNQGFKQAMVVLDGGRISIAALSLGVARGALECSQQYAAERAQFGKTIDQFQGIQFKLADMATNLDAARLLTLRSAYNKDRGQAQSIESAMAKYFASEVSVRNSEEAVQIHGGYGYLKEYPAEKFWRDSKLLTIGEGTSEVQKIVIARELKRAFEMARV
ncbi:acyl-CoA dehydrogenase family protein [Acanthopleuribacter pedis]|uniref:Acyl-CoA dehydrogenase family protein n=1 Tax=Acanthopleuribacter pedis TaxID=442870 RepID=A0A8J7QAT2_9BACT|nr:acyl-CoA dehydrogenase family protein [Acanthopleuribacter pedis]